MIVRAKIDLFHAPLALAHAALGDRDQAYKHLKIARPRLVALKEQEVLARCEDALDWTR